MKKSGLWWMIAGLAVAGLAGWYLAALLEQPLIFALVAAVAVIVGGYLLTEAQAKRAQSEKEALNSILEKMDALSAETAKANALTAEKLDETEQKLCTEISGVGEKLANQQKAYAERINQTIDDGKDSVLTAVAELNSQNQKIQQAQAANDEKQWKNTEKITAALNSFAASFENSVEAYKEMEKRMAALEQQNVHLQHLTTMIGTVRSDIASINEVKGFVSEAKEGKKVRIARDDENKIVVESLMNSDGVRIEKSKMYKNNKLCFEAEFNDIGQMILSRSFNKNGEPDTIVTYVPEEQGRPTIREIVAEKVGNLLAKKRK